MENDLVIEKKTKTKKLKLEKSAPTKWENLHYLFVLRFVSGTYALIIV